MHKSCTDIKHVATYASDSTARDELEFDSTRQEVIRTPPGPEDNEMDFLKAGWMDREKDVGTVPSEETCQRSLSSAFSCEKNLEERRTRGDLRPHRQNEQLRSSAATFNLELFDIPEWRRACGCSCLR